MPLPRPETEDALHSVECGLNEVVQIPYLVGIPGCRDPELQAYGETGILRLDACRGDRCPDCVLPWLLMSAGATRRTADDVNGHMVTIDHAL